MAAPDFVASNLHAEAIAPPRVARHTSSREWLRCVIFLAESVADFAVCAFGMVASQALIAIAFAHPNLLFQARNALPMGLTVGLVVTFLLNRDRAYRSSGSLLQIRATERAIRATAQGLTLVIAIRVLLGLAAQWLPSLVAFFAVPVLLILERRILHIALRLLRIEGRSLRAVIYGAGELGRRVLSTLLQSPELCLDPVAVLDDTSADHVLLEMGYRGRRSIPVVRGTVTSALLKSCRCGLLLLAKPNLAPDRLAGLNRAAHQAGSRVAVLRSFDAVDPAAKETIEVDGILFTTSRDRPNSSLNEFTRRCADLLISSSLLVLLAPLFALIAILICLDSRGPALFVQRRVGQDGELFRLFKFRSMFPSAPKYARSPVSSSDPRITRVGKVLRRMSLDELPQLFNVLNGTMSLVGPRPEMPFIVQRYDSRLRQRLAVKPGITGLWQLSADRTFPIHENIEYDLYYIRNRTFSMDAAILVHTLIFAFCGGI
jgi:exopolysaccharide biosynthesis polyprenyl glycosylphosphotransferase